MGFIDGFLDKMKLNGNYDEDEEYDGYDDDEEEDVVKPHRVGLKARKAVAVQAEQPLENCPRSAHIRKAEQNPAKEHDQQQIEVADELGRFCELVAQAEILDNEEHKEVKPPQHEVPACAVPQPC